MRPAGALGEKPSNTNLECRRELELRAVEILPDRDLIRGFNEKAAGGDELDPRGEGEHMASRIGDWDAAACAPTIHRAVGFEIHVDLLGREGAVDAGQHAITKRYGKPSDRSACFRFSSACL